MIWNVASARNEISLRKWFGGTAHLRNFIWSTGRKKRVLLAAMLLFYLCFFTHSINQGWANLFDRRVICWNQKHQWVSQPVCSVNTNMV